MNQLPNNDQTTTKQPPNNNQTKAGQRPNSNHATTKQPPNNDQTTKQRPSICACALNAIWSLFGDQRINRKTAFCFHWRPQRTPDKSLQWVMQARGPQNIKSLKSMEIEYGRPIWVLGAFPEN